MILSILAFLFISFGYSLYEKLKDKKGYISFLTHHLKQQKAASFFWWLLVFVNTITSVVLLLTIASILFHFSHFPILMSFKTTAIAILILLFGQRIAGDYQGAANLCIYMIINVLGWYLYVI